MGFTLLVSTPVISIMASGTATARILLGVPGAFSRPRAASGEESETTEISLTE